MRERMARYCSAATLLVISVILGYFFLTGRLNAYIHPGFRPLVFISAIILLALFVGLIISKVPWGCANPECFDQHGRLTLGRFFVYGAVMLPLIGAAAITPDGYGANVVRNRGFVEDVRFLAARAPTPARDQARASPGHSSARMDLPALPGPTGSDTGDYVYEDGWEGDPFEPFDYIRRNEEGQIMAEVLDLLFAAEETDLRGDFEGQEVEVIGQFFPAETNNPRGDRFRLMRMFMICCAADAQPISVLVEAPGWPQDINEMQWIRVVGKAEFPVAGGRRITIIRAEEIEATQAPDEIMLF